MEGKGGECALKHVVSARPTRRASLDLAGGWASCSSSIIFDVGHGPAAEQVASCQTYYSNHHEPILAARSVVRVIDNVQFSKRDRNRWPGLIRERQLLSRWRLDNQKRL